MSVLANAEQCHVEERSIGIKPFVTIIMLQQGLIFGRGPLRSYSLGRDCMNAILARRNARKKCIVNHAIVTVGMIMRDETLVAPKPGRAIPRKTRSDAIAGKVLIETPWRRSAGQTNCELALTSTCEHAKPFGSVFSNRLGGLENAPFAQLCGVARHADLAASRGEYRRQMLSRFHRAPFVVGISLSSARCPHRARRIPARAPRLVF